MSVMGRVGNRGTFHIISPCDPAFGFPLRWGISEAAAQVIRNILHCLDHGCALGWMLDAEERPLAGISQSAVLIYPAGEQPIFVEDLDEVLRVPELVAGLQLTLGDLWGWMKI
jgi:Uma2 family endonuclease